MSTFQINSKSIFLTFPQCDYSLDLFREKIELFFHGNIEKGVISREKHQDGNWHLHAAICLERPFRARGEQGLRAFDSLVDPPKHPNISSRFTGGILKAFQYVMKEGNFLALNEPAFNLTQFMEAATKKKSTRSKIISEELMDPNCTNRNQVLFDHADFMLLHLKKAQAFVDWLEARDRRLQYAEAQTRLVRVQPAAGFWSSWNNEIASWLNANLRKPRAHRQKQLWICAPPRMGKTSLVMFLEAVFKLSIYYWPRDEKWWDGYEDDAYDLIVLDEFFTQKTITELNPILSGDPIPLSRRGSSPYVKRQNLPVIILSNYTPEDCFTRVAVNQPHKIAPLLDRLTVVDAKGPIRMKALQDDEAIPVADQDQQPARSASVPPAFVNGLPNHDHWLANLAPRPLEAEVEVIPDSPEYSPMLPVELTPSPIETLTTEIEASLQRDWANSMEEFERNNDPFYFDRVSRHSRALLIAERNQPQPSVASYYRSRDDYHDSLRANSRQ